MITKATDNSAMVFHLWGEMEFVTLRVPSLVARLNTYRMPPNQPGQVSEISHYEFVTHYVRILWDTVRKLFNMWLESFIFG